MAEKAVAGRAVAGKVVAGEPARVRPTGGRVSLMVGDEALLAERAVRRVISGAGEGADIRQASAADLTPTELAALAGPSLFGDAAVVVVRDAQEAPAPVATALTSLAADPRPGMSLVITHAGGVKGKALLTSLTKAGAEVTECRKITRIGDRMDFVRGEFRTAGRKVTEPAMRALLDAVGSDLAELASACGQLIADTEGVVGPDTVARYYRGRAEASGFSIADRAVEGRLGEALEQLRWALAVGVPPVLITSALASGLRLLGRVGAAPRGLSGAALASEVGAPPWKIDKLRQQLPGWSPAGIAQALAAVAEADAQVKGEGTNPGYALEVAVQAVAAARTARL